MHLILVIAMLGAEQDLLDQAKLGWTKLGQCGQSVDSEGRAEVKVTNSGKLETHAYEWFHVKCQGDNVVVQHARDSKPERATVREVVLGINDSYHFTAQRVTPSRPWLLESVASDDEEAEVEALQKQMHGLGWPSPFTDCPFAIYGKRLSDLVQDPNFKLRAMDAGVLEFDYVPAESDAVKISGGKVALDPKRQWAIVSYEVKIPNATSRGEITYDDGDCPRPKTLHFHETFTDGESKGFEVDWKVQFDKYSNAPIPAGDFMLASYGLPEPGSPGGSGSMGYALIGLAIVGLVCAFLLRRRS